MIQREFYEYCHLDHLGLMGGLPLPLLGFSSSISIPSPLLLSCRIKLPTTTLTCWVNWRRWDPCYRLRSGPCPLLYQSRLVGISRWFNRWLYRGVRRRGSWYLSWILVFVRRWYLLLLIRRGRRGLFIFVILGFLGKGKGTYGDWDVEIWEVIFDHLLEGPF